MRFLLDTNVCICFLRGRPQRLVARVRATRLDDLAISSVVVAELLHGALRSRDPARETALVEGFVGNLTVLPFDSLTAASYASVRRSLEVKSALIGAFDMLIAATALRHGLVLVTHNTAEFARVDRLVLDDWEST